MDGDDDDEREKSPAASEHDHEQPKQHPHVIPTPIRWRVIVLHYKAWTVPEIMDALGVSRSTCYAVIKLFEASGDGALLVSFAGLLCSMVLASVLF